MRFVKCLLCRCYLYCSGNAFSGPRFSYNPEHSFQYQCFKWMLLLIFPNKNIMNKSMWHLRLLMNKCIKYACCNMAHVFQPSEHGTMPELIIHRICTMTNKSNLSSNTHTHTPTHPDMYIFLITMEENPHLINNLLYF